MTTETKIEKVTGDNLTTDNVDIKLEEGEYLKDGKKYNGMFDYGSITARDKKVVEEVINVMRERQGIPFSMVEEELKVKFELKTVPMMKIEDSIWYQLTKDEKLGQGMQGHRDTTDENGERIRIPHIGFSADLDYLDEFVNRLAKKIQSLPQTKDK